MSAFMCGHCEQLRDADDGCEEYGLGLICAPCLERLPEIETDHVYPPIPARDSDWAATFDNYDGAPDSGNRHHIGRGATRGEAIKDLIVNYGDEA